MTIFGLNLLVVCKELNIPLESIKTYKLDNQNTVTLYEIENPNILLNIPSEYLKNYNAWITVPGEYRGYYTELIVVKIKDDILQVPKLILKKRVTKADDIFGYLVLQYGSKKFRIFDLVYTIARVNGLGLQEFLEKYAIEW